MKAAQELLIFPFPNFFIFFIMWYLEEKKNPSLAVTQKQIQTNHSKKKIHDAIQALLLPVWLGHF